ncbi:MAG: hypothetical protein ACKVQA_18585 [Burkholderiales bacterium]
MSRQLMITYYADRELLGLVSDEDYEAFKDLLLGALHGEWPKAAVNVDDAEHAYVEIELAPGAKGEAPLDEQARADVEARVIEIANDVIDNREWATEEPEVYDEDYEEELAERRFGEDREDY